MNFFFYGTLCDADVRRRVLGRELPDAQVEEAVLSGFSPLFVADATYPTLIARPGGHAPGLLARGLGAADAARLAAFEGPAYCTRTLTVTGRRRPASLSSGARRGRPGGRGRWGTGSGASSRLSWRRARSARAEHRAGPLHWPPNHPI